MILQRLTGLGVAHQHLGGGIAPLIDDLTGIRCANAHRLGEQPLSLVCGQHPTGRAAAECTRQQLDRAVAARRARRTLGSVALRGQEVSGGSPAAMLMAPTGQTGDVPASTATVS
ncbi:hypothetical protein C1I98_28395 [Spongiactinospora gelatinilytica]|uniref:Uncharacterized protein n=1 Tax=Spongiactinospora gelatinilytica TaxID=2666298 RepID=A0A2W2GA17_9ACTN|nr:hypothetical protein C1I98_28395 [Spongiactinospora gelatinilytica]